MSIESKGYILRIQVPRWWLKIMSGGEKRASEQKIIIKYYFLYNSKGDYGVGFNLQSFY